MSFVRFIVIACVCAAFLLPACSPLGGSLRPVAFYTLEYSTPAPQDTGSDTIVKFDRFYSARSYDSTAMLYKPDAYKIVAYNYHRWRTTPSDMVTDCLLRDFLHSGLFRAVFSYRQPETARFLVGGGVEEFVEAREANGWNAVLSLHVTLLDLNQDEGTEKVVFQKRYRVAQPIDGESPEFFAEGMSAAMARISMEIIDDVSRATKGQAGQRP